MKIKQNIIALLLAANIVFNAGKASIPVSKPVIEKEYVCSGSIYQNEQPYEMADNKKYYR